MCLKRIYIIIIIIIIINLCFVITQYHGRSLSIKVDYTISPNIAIIQQYGWKLDPIQPLRMSIQIAPSVPLTVLTFSYLQYQGEMLYQYCQACQKLFLLSLRQVTTTSYRSLSIVFVHSSWRRSEVAEFTLQKAPSIKVATTSSQHLITTCVDVTMLSAEIQTIYCNYVAEKLMPRQGNWDELTFAKTSGTVTGERGTKWANS